MSNAQNCSRCGGATPGGDFGAGCPNCRTLECAGAYILPEGVPTMRCGDWLFLAMLIAANVVPWSVLVWGMLQ